MDFQLTLHTPDDVDPAQRQGAERRFRQALVAALGDEALVVPVYRAYQSILGRHGQAPDPQALTVDERAVLEHWQAAEAAAMAAVFGPHRHLDEGDYEIVLP